MLFGDPSTLSNAKMLKKCEWDRSLQTCPIGVESVNLANSDFKALDLQNSAIQDHGYYKSLIYNLVADSESVIRFPTERKIEAE